MIRYKYPPDTPTISILMESEINGPAAHVISLAKQSDLYIHYVPFCQKSSVIKNIDRTSILAHAQMNLPFISDREVFLYGDGFQRLDENGTITLVSKTFDDD